MLEDLISGPLGLFIIVFAFVWGLLMFFAPFFWYYTQRYTRETRDKLDELIKLQKEQMANTPPKPD